MFGAHQLPENRQIEMFHVLSGPVGEGRACPGSYHNRSMAEACDQAAPGARPTSPRL